MYIGIFFIYRKKNVVEIFTCHPPPSTSNQFLMHPSKIKIQTVKKKILFQCLKINSKNFENENAKIHIRNIPFESFKG